MKVYKIARGWAILIYFFAPLLIGLFCWVFTLPFANDEADWKAFMFLGPISLGMIGMMVVGLIDAVKGRVKITQDTVSIRSTFINRDLKFEEIKGFKTDRQYVYILPKTSDKKRIKISTYTGKIHELTTWLEMNFPNLDKSEMEHEEKEILSNEEYGATATQRADRLKQAKKTANILNYFGGGIALWVLFFPEPYKYAVLSSIIYPTLALLITMTFRGLVRLDDDRTNSPYPSTLTAIMMPASALLLRALLDFQIFDYANVWIPVTEIAVGTIILMVIATKYFKFKSLKHIFGLLGMCLICFMYGYGTVISINGVFDDSVPEVYTARVLDKRAGSSRSTRHYLKLEPWGPDNRPDEVVVSREMFDSIEKNEVVTIYLKHGKWNIPWYLVQVIGN